MSIKFEEIFDGVAVVIDDEIENKTANITKILNQLAYKNIPHLKYDDLPELEVSNFRNISFVILDWELNADEINDKDILSGIKKPKGLEINSNKRNIDFINSLRKKCFCPVFIFSNHNIQHIKSILKKAKLNWPTKNGHRVRQFYSSVPIQQVYGT